MTPCMVPELQCPGRNRTNTAVWSPMRRALALLFLLSVGLTHAATSSLETTSPMGGNGHNVTFDGRLFIVRTGPGWEARVLRPQAIGVTAGQPPSLSNAFSPGVLIQGPTNEENAL